MSLPEARSVGLMGRIKRHRLPGQRAQLSKEWNQKQLIRRDENLRLAHADCNHERGAALDEARP